MLGLWSRYRVIRFVLEVPSRFHASLPMLPGFQMDAVDMVSFPEYRWDPILAGL